MGILYYPNTTNLKVDIGNAIDLLRFNLDSTHSFITIGVEFMAYAYSLSYQGYRLQIGMLDGFFGGNAVYTINSPGNKTSIRFRFIHNSAHLVDGYYDPTTGWLNGRLPIPFTRDFAELLFTDAFQYGPLYLRPYGGGSFATRVRPGLIKQMAYCAGGEIHTESGAHTFLGKPFEIFAAYHLNISGLPVYVGSNHAQVGVKFGTWDKKGINFYLSYFKGNNMFNEFYYEKIERFGVGFSVDFP